MSYFKSTAKPYAGYNPGGPLDGKKHLEWPFGWICTADATSSTTWYCPFYITPTQADEWWKRFRALQPDFSLTASGFTFNRNPALNRKILGVTVTDEIELEQPGIRADDTYGTPRPGAFIYSATQNDDGWNGPGSTSDFSLQAEFFMKQRVVVNGLDVDIPHMIFQTDGALIMPSIRVFGSLIVTTPGTELSWFFETSDLASPAYTDTVEILPSHGGASVDLNFSSATVNPSAFNLAINPSIWFTHGGKWDESTGARV